MPPAPSSVPMWMWRLAIWVVGGILAAVSAVLGWVGKKYVETRADQIETLRDDIEELKAEMRGDHAGVEDRVARLDDKLDTVIEELV